MLPHSSKLSCGVKKLKKKKKKKEDERGRTGMGWIHNAI